MTAHPDDLVQQIEREFGHPTEIWLKLREEAQLNSVVLFADVRLAWLELMDSIDAYRRNQILPRGTPAGANEEQRLGVLNRTKGHWFSALITLLLQHRTSQVLRPRARVDGYSQRHQIDIAWPHRLVDPLVCVETKVTGAPGFKKTPARGAMADWTNRRKELKFAATDLKLFPRQQLTSIRHWGVWREQAPPKTYFLWGARLRAGDEGRSDSIGYMTTEAQALAATYLDGVGIEAWTTGLQGRYESVSTSSSNLSLDDTLYRIQSEIENSIDENGLPPAPVHVDRLIDVSKLAEPPAEYEA